MIVGKVSTMNFETWRRRFSGRGATVTCRGPGHQPRVPFVGYGGLQSLGQFLADRVRPESDATRRALRRRCREFIPGHVGREDQRRDLTGRSVRGANGLARIRRDVVRFVVLRCQPRASKPGPRCCSGGVRRTSRGRSRGHRRYSAPAHSPDAVVQIRPAVGESGPRCNNVAAG